MKFGINTFLWSVEFTRREFPLLQTIREHGFNGVEIPLLRIAGFDAAEIRRAIEASGLESTVCAVLPPPLSLISEDAQVRRETIAHLSRAIELSAEAGARIMAGPVYNPVGKFTGVRRTTDEWKRAIDGYRELGPVLAKHDVQLAIEPLNRFETYFLNTTTDAVSLCDEVDHPNIGILWDTFHANVEEKHLGTALLRTGRHLKHVHTCENDRGTPGTGHVDWNAVFAALRKLGYNGWLTIESFGFSAGDLSAAASIWRDLEKTPDEIAWNGIKFLKHNCEAVPAQVGV
jgi:D-psicose/D-tagatose/L-ribulose 3-epimerase